MAGLMSHRDGRLYLIGQSLSVVGDGALWLGMAIWVKMITHSNSAAGLVFFSFICGSLMAPVGGVIADRVRRLPLLVWANLGSALGVCALLLVHGSGQVWLIYLVMFGYGMVGSTILSAQTALLPVILPKDLLVSANSFLQMAEQGLRIVTPVLGAGLLTLIGPGPVILLDAATFLAAGLATAAIRTKEPAPATDHGHWRAEFTAGIRHIGRTPALRRLLLAGLMALLAFGFFQTVAFAVVAEGLHRSPAFLGVLQCAMGAGAVAGGLSADAISRRTDDRMLVLGGILAAALGCLLMLTDWLPVILVGMALVGGCNLWINVGGYTIIQRRTPNHLIGRVDAALSMAIMIPQALSIAVGAALITVVDYHLLLIAMAVILGVAGLPLTGRQEYATVPGNGTSDVAAAESADAARQRTP